MSGFLANLELSLKIKSGLLIGFSILFEMIAEDLISEFETISFLGSATFCSTTIGLSGLMRRNNCRFNVFICI